MASQNKVAPLIRTVSDPRMITRIRMLKATLATGTHPRSFGIAPLTSG